ncbi:MAG: hypothetical protein FJZ01_04835 [Candidatus Sericytochromatia bacterium]|nr:hypothetical protein [Candidatus Tanganyikabacteria bacterium]
MPEHTSSTRYRWQGHSLELVIEDLTDRHPEDYPWGLLLRDDLASGRGEIFYWFGSPGEALAYLAEAEPLIHLQDDDPAVARIRREVAAATADLGTTLPEARIPETNVLLAGGGEILWWGHLDDLLAAATPRSRRVVRRFRDLAGAGGKRGPVRPEEHERFIGFLCGDPV